MIAFILILILSQKDNAMDAVERGRHVKGTIVLMIAVYIFLYGFKIEIGHIGLSTNSFIPKETIKKDQE